MGRPAFFLRTYGCPVHCPWCDSAGTWHPDWVPQDVQRMSVEQIITEVKASKADMIVVTGGEPTIHDLCPLTAALRMDNVAIHLETSGGFPIKGEFDWITLSPKRWKLPLSENVKWADEFKFIIETPDDIAFYWSMITKLGHISLSGEWVPTWLHPEWSQRENPEVLKAICDAVKQGEGRFRAGWQLHKCFRVDQHDARTRPLVPLGGESGRGY